MGRPEEWKSHPLVGVVLVHAGLVSDPETEHTGVVEWVMRSARSVRKRRHSDLSVSVSLHDPGSVIQG